MSTIINDLLDDFVRFPAYYLLNNICSAGMNQCDIDLRVKSIVKHPCAVDYSYDALPIFAEKYNQTQSSNTLTAINHFPKNVSNQKIN